MVCEQLQQINQSMIGWVNLRLVIVNGPPGTSAAFDLLEIVRVRAITIEATRLLSKLAAAQPPVPKLVWNVRTDIVDIATPPLSVNPSPTGQAAPALFEAREAPWRDPALTDLVNSTGTAGLQALRVDTLGSANHAVSVFWTRYEAQWTGYVDAGQAKAVLSFPLFDPPGTVRTNVSLAAAVQVTAHEVCHLFSAPDEYAASQCKVLDGRGCGFGSQDFPNFNCANTVGAVQVPCLMRNPAEQVLCPASRIHLGWV